MLRHRPPSPLDRRVDAHRPISADLLAAASSSPVELADEFRTGWFAIIQALTDRGVVIVFDEFVVGRPDPLLLEVVHQLRLVRRAEHRGDFDQEEEDWYEEYADDDDADYERPTLAARVLAQMVDGQESERLATDAIVTRWMNRLVPWERDEVMTHVRLGIALARLVVELADAIKIGGAVTLDARLTGERINRLCWAA